MAVVCIGKRSRMMIISAKSHSRLHVVDLLQWPMRLAITKWYRRRRSLLVPHESGFASTDSAPSSSKLQLEYSRLVQCNLTCTDTAFDALKAPEFIQFSFPAMGVFRKVH
jgi:hypothetical protein